MISVPDAEKPKGNMIHGRHNGVSFAYRGLMAMYEIDVGEMELTEENSLTESTAGNML